MCDDTLFMPLPSHIELYVRVLFVFYLLKFGDSAICLKARRVPLYCVTLPSVTTKNV